MKNPLYRVCLSLDWFATRSKMVLFALALWLTFSLGFVSNLKAQKFEEHKVKTQMIRLPLERLPADVITYSGHTHTIFSEKARTLNEKEYIQCYTPLHFNSYHGVDGADGAGEVYALMVIENGLVFKDVALRIHERKYTQTYKDTDGKMKSKYVTYHAYYYKVEYKSPIVSYYLKLNLDTLKKVSYREMLGNSQYDIFGYGKVHSSSDTQIPTDIYRNEKDLRDAWNPVKQDILLKLERDLISCDYIRSFSDYYCPSLRVWEAKIEVIKDKEGKYTDYLEAVEAYKQGLKFVETDKIAKINKVIRPDYDKRVASFKKAIEIWEKMLSEPREKKSRMNDIPQSCICLLVDRRLCQST